MCVCFIVLLSGSHCLVSFYARVCRYIHTVLRACVTHVKRERETCGDHKQSLSAHRMAEEVFL